MAIDKSEPRVGLIFRIGLLVVGLLIGTRALLNSYFDEIASAEESRKIGQEVPQPLIDLRADEQHRLTSGPMPVDQAMQAIVSKGRMAASPDIMPSASRDLGPMQGWSKLPREVPAMMMAPPPPPPSADAGAPAATPAGDAGVHAPVTPKKPAKKQP
jgi:hypothetical protein